MADASNPMSDPLEGGAPPLPSAPPTLRGTAPTFRARPNWPTVIGVIGCILGSLAAVGGAWGIIAPWFMDQMMSWMPSAGAAASGMQAVQEYLPLQSAVGAVSMVVAILLIVGSAQLLKRRPQAARTLRIWAWSKCGVALLASLATFMMQSAQFKAMSTSGGPAMPAGMLQAMAAFGLIFSIAWLAAFPVFMLIWLRRPSVREEIARW